MLKSKLVHWTNYWYAMRQKFPLFPLRIPHKGKNKGKYISFHYLMGWKACKIRKVQEISPQIPIVLIFFTPTFLPFGQEVSLAQRARSIPICCHLHYTSLAIEKIAYFMKLVGWEQLATQGVPRWQVHKRVAGGSQRRGSVASPVWFGADHDCGKSQPSGEEPSENARHQPLGGV